MTREEAIRILASSCIPGSKQTEALETLIPELAESEDERIRKKLVEYHSQQFEKNRDQEIGLFHKDALAWLEKQKEQKPNFDTHWENGSMVCMQKEQKPVNHKFTTWHRDVVYCAMCNKNLDEGLRCNLEVVYKTIKELVDRTPVVEEQKLTATANGEPIPTENLSVNIPLVEWSEEDEEALDMCLDAIPKKWKIKSGILLTKWLKDTIHSQLKQEWSEEDEKYLNRVINLWVNDFGEDNDTVKWLKSLRPQPHWKPSEEQMKALLNAEGLLRKYRHIAIASKLAELYEQLKKL